MKVDQPDQNLQRRIFDTHAHLDLADFDQDREALFAQMAGRGIVKALIPAISPQHWSRQIEIANLYNCPFALGIHPWYISGEADYELQLLQDALNMQADNPNLVAIGECGLDAYKQETWPWQMEYLTRQLQIAKDLKLPVILHVVKAHEQMLNVLKQADLPRTGVIHAYTGGLELATRYVDLGFKLGIGSIAINQQAKKLRRTLTHIPLESLVVETDSPFMAPRNSRLKRHSPLFIEQYVDEIACLRKKTSVFICEQLFANSVQLFDI